jgi:hypothetical protein
MSFRCCRTPRFAISSLIVACFCVAQEPESPTFQTTVFGTTVVAPGSLEGKIYFIPEVKRLPNLAKLKPVGTIYAKSLNIPLTEFREGFPGITDRFEWFAIEYTGTIYIANPGKYNFRLHSDDGSKLFIDGKNIIDIDALGTFTASGFAKLTAGVHDIRIDYFQGPRYHLQLIFEVQSPGADRFHLFNTDDFRDDSRKDASEPANSGPRIPLAEQQQVIELAAQKAVAYTSHLPDFLCTEAVERTENRAKAGWKRRDTLTIQLSYTDHAEHYQLMAIDNRPTRATYESVGGAVSGGEFGSMIAEILEPHAARFEWLRVEKVRDQTVYVFKYSISREKSKYSIQYRSSAKLLNRIAAGHHGLVYIEPQTGALLRVTRIADLPAGTPIRDANTTLDYGFTDVGGQAFLLPLFADNDLSTYNLQTHNHVRFLNYRKFDAGSKLILEDR